MATLLELLSALPEDAMRDGAQVGIADSQGREWTITFGEHVPVAEPPFSFAV